MSARTDDGTAPFPPLRRYPALDGLRGLAAYAVVLSHYVSMTRDLHFPFHQSGRLGVMVFFILSGFLMGTIYLRREWNGTEIAGFFRKRVARVVPLYLLVVLASYLLMSTIGKNYLYKVVDGNLLQHLLFLKGANVLWTIAAEIQFYLLFPLVWLLFRKTDAPTTALVLFLAISVCLIFWTRESPVFFRVVPFFLLGTLAAMLDVRRTRLMDVLFVCAGIAVFLSLPTVKGWLGFPQGGGWNSGLHMGTMFVLLLSAANSDLADRLLGNRAMAFLGAISYSVYLLHLPLLRTLKRIGLLGENAGLNLLLVFVVVTAVSAIVYYLFEQPMRRLLSGEYGRRKALAARPAAETASA
jgi:peptidoglycan/LPS O-acetylase OafA/YrhL